MLMQEQVKENALVFQNNQALDVVSGATLGILSAYLPFTIAMAIARSCSFTAHGDKGTIESAAVVGLATVLLAVPLAIEARRSTVAIAVTSALVFLVLGFVTALTF